MEEERLYSVVLKNHPKLEIYANSKEEFHAILDDYLKDKPNVKIVKITEEYGRD